MKQANTPENFAEADTGVEEHAQETIEVNFLKSSLQVNIEKIKEVGSTNIADKEKTNNAEVVPHVYMEIMLASTTLD